ncbi:MAG TPA: alpha/beta fold hydrolase [Saprospiraceae bacterium]|nr:alpha/beta fold hydrolase [Saprospiraceae bacterium]HND86826.1 alpha/beta fold hydrolase [Saprospiraceae bacterium]
MRKVLIWLSKATLFALAFLLALYLLGPRPAVPVFAKKDYPEAASLAELEAAIQRREAAEPGIKPDCGAKIVWADTSRRVKTPIALLYLHGFGASRQEAAPLPEDLARHFGCNLYLARMDEHGVDEGDANLCELSADSYAESAEEALSVAQQLGDSVVILGTSGGGALGLFLAARHPEVKGLVTWSPAVRLFRRSAALLPGPWSVQLARLITGHDHNEWAFRKPIEQPKYWTNHQCWEGVVQFAVFLKYAMTPATFAAIRCPVFVGYYYEDEEHQDKAVSVAAMREMLAQLSTPSGQKREVNFPNARDHVISSAILSSDWQGVERESAAFMQEVMGMQAAGPAIR